MIKFIKDVERSCVHLQDCKYHCDYNNCLLPARELCQARLIFVLLDFAFTFERDMHFYAAVDFFVHLNLLCAVRELTWVRLLRYIRCVCLYELQI